MPKSTLVTPERSSPSPTIWCDFLRLPISISQSEVDYVVQVESLGDPNKIVSTTTRLARDPAALLIAKYASEVIEASGLLQDDFSFQTGAGGTSLAVADLVHKKMAAKKIKGSFGCGGITGYFVDMLEQGYFRHASRCSVLRPEGGGVASAQP